MSLSIPAIKVKSKAGRMWEPPAGLLCTCRKYTLVSELENSLGPLPVPGAWLSVPPGSESLVVLRGHDHLPTGLMIKSHSHCGCRTRGIRQYEIQVTLCPISYQKVSPGLSPVPREM